VGICAELRDVVEDEDIEKSFVQPVNNLSFDIPFDEK